MPAKSEAPMSEKRVELKVVAYDAGALAIISPDEPRTATTSAPPIEVPPDPAAPGLPE